MNDNEKVSGYVRVTKNSDKNTLKIDVSIPLEFKPRQSVVNGVAMALPNAALATWLFNNGLPVLAAVSAIYAVGAGVKKYYDHKKFVSMAVVMDMSLEAASDANELAERAKEIIRRFKKMQEDDE